MKKNHKNNQLLIVKNLSLDVLNEKGKFPLIRNVSFTVHTGETLGIVGESGSGKTVTCLSLTKLLPQPPIYYREGEVIFNGEDIWQWPVSRLQQVRGTGMSIVFQEAFSSLNPVIKVGQQVSEVFQIHFGLNKKQAREQTIALFRQVGIPNPEARYNHYPHQLSGGLQQRVMIAMALAGNPSLLIADEPTTALDVTIQVQIIELLKTLKKNRQMAIIFINHDLGLIAEMCDRVLVMYAGEIVEAAPIRNLFNNPIHPYTQLLMNSVPQIRLPRGEFIEIPGNMPSPAEYPTGCAFHPRCPFASLQCQEKHPDLTLFNSNHTYRCWHPKL